MNAQSSFKKGKVSSTRKIAVFCLILVISLTSFSFNSMGFSTPISSGIDITYEVNITSPPETEIKIKATYTNITTSPFRLEIGYENWPTPTLSVFKDLQFSSPDGKNLSWKEIDYRTIEVNSTGNSIVANYSMDLTKTNPRGTMVLAIGGGLSGFEAFPLPSNQKVQSVKVKFTAPDPWTVVSVYLKEGERFTIKPFTFEDILLETKASGWYFGNVDFDYTKTYEDGFEIRVVGFKYFDYEHWNVYLGDTPLEEALKSADFYHETYLRIKEIYGEYPFKKILLVGPGYWQAGNTYLNQQLVGWYRYEYIPHHMLHAFFGLFGGSRIMFYERFYFLLREGYPTYAEGIMTSEITGDPVWKGMLYERKIHYLRGNKFNTMEQNSRQYVLGFIVTYLMDKEIRRETNGQKGIHDLMARIWKKYSSPNFVLVLDEQVLETLKEITGHDWHWFYEQNVINTNKLSVDELDDFRNDFKVFLKAISDYWYNGYQSMYFIGQEIVSAAGDFDMNVRMQDPMHISPNIGDFVVAAHRYKDVTQSDLTENDIEEILHQVTSKDHSDFFEFYRSQGFDVDPKEITEYVKTFTYVGHTEDNAIKLVPNTFPLGKSTNVIGEIVDGDFAKSKELSLIVQVYDKPIGLTDIQNLITGKGVFYQGKQEFANGVFGAGANYFFKLPKIEIGDKAYTFFTINLPEDAGIMLFSFGAKTSEPTYGSWLGGFIGTKKVSFQSGSTFHFKPSNSKVVDSTPPVFSITEPKSSEVSTELKTICIKGLVEPEAKVLINGKEATISDTSFEFSGSVDLQPEENIIKVEVSDKAGNTVSREIEVKFSDTNPPEVVIYSPDDNFKTNENTVTVSGTILDKESGIDKVTVNGAEISISSYGSFSATVNLAEGVNKITVIAIDKAGNQTTKALSIIYEKAVITIILQIGKTKFTVNGNPRTLDSPPVIKNSRTLLPIRAIIEALGGTVGWDATERKVTITLGSTSIELWIGKSTALVNGVSKLIDSSNSKVVPEIINSRTMIPLRFVTENLSCSVNWEPTTKTVTITYLRN